MAVTLTLCAQSASPAFNTAVYSVFVFSTCLCVCVFSADRVRLRSTCGALTRTVVCPRTDTRLQRPLRPHPHAHRGFRVLLGTQVRAKSHSGHDYCCGCHASLADRCLCPSARCSPSAKLAETIRFSSRLPSHPDTRANKRGGNNSS